MKRPKPRGKRQELQQCPQKVRYFFFRIINQLFVLGFQYLGAIRISSFLLALMYIDGRLCGLVFPGSTPGRVSRHASKKC